MKRLLSVSAVVLLSVVLLSACHGGGGGGGFWLPAKKSYTVGGTVSGLTGSGLVLQNNSGDDLSIAADGSFTFATKIVDGGTYLVTVKTQPSGPTETCTASNNSGTVSGANVTSVSVVCSVNAYSVGGTVSGLTGSGLELQNNNTDYLSITSNGTFTFATPVADGAGYYVTVKTQPGGQTCTVSSGSGTMSGANVTNIGVTCVAGVIELPKTGQTTCYDASGATIACTGTGQDGELKKGVTWPNPRFTVASSGTGTVVTDNLTGLMWPQSAGTPTFSICSGGTTSWQGALNYVACLNTNNYLNHNDWRLPNANEQKSLIDKSQTDPALPAGHPFTNVQIGSSYWLSTTFAGNTSYALDITMNDGSLSRDLKTNSNQVWPVRDAAITATISLPKTGQTTSYASADDGDLRKGVAWPSPRFTDNSDGTITDNLTGLMWLKNANCINTAYSSFDADGTAGDGAVTWQHALDFVVGINAGTYSNCGGGRTGWRLPNDVELESLMDFSRYNPALPAGHPFTNVAASIYWSSTTSNMATSRAWWGGMYYGNASIDFKTGNWYVWPVRGGQ